MRTTIILFLLCMLTVKMQADAKSDGKIFYFPVVTGDGIPEQAKKSLTIRMEQTITQNGFGATNNTDRFVMLAKCSVLEKNIAPTTPPRVTQTVNITFIIGDAIENKTYASVAFELKGIGTTETKAWQIAFNNINPANAELVRLFEQASEKIESYYSANCRQIISDAKSIAAIGDYDRAIYMLMSVPDVCVTCHHEALSEATVIYSQKINAEGADLLIKAQNAWAMSPDTDGAETAFSYLNSISPASTSFESAEKLAKTIGDKISSDKEREWEQRIKEYNDEKEFRRREQANAHARSMETIKACRSVAEKWAENQPQTKIYLNW